MCTFSMLAKKWVRKSLRRCSLKPGLAAAMMLAGVLLLPSSAAAQSPPGCLANEFDVTLVASTLGAVAGDTVNFFVFVENTGFQPGCDVTAVTFDFICPDGTQTNVVTNATYPFPTTPFLAGTFACVMPSGVEFATGKGPGHLPPAGCHSLAEYHQQDDHRDRPGLSRPG